MRGADDRARDCPSVAGGQIPRPVHPRRHIGASRTSARYFFLPFPSALAGASGFSTEIATASV